MANNQQKFLRARRFCITSFILGILSLPFTIMLFLMTNFSIPNTPTANLLFLCPIAAVVALVLGIFGLRLLGSKEDVPSQTGSRLFLAVLASMGIMLALCLVVVLFLKYGLILIFVLFDPF